MSQAFDPYHKWLGIAPKDQPPNHYRLLGIDLFESDREVIQSAGEQRIAHVRTFQLSEYAEATQRILNELAAARVCLLNAEKKAAYDAKLKARQRPTATAYSRVAAPVAPLLPPVELDISDPRGDSAPALAGQPCVAAATNVAAECVSAKALTSCLAGAGRRCAHRRDLAGRVCVMAAAR